MNFLLFFLDGVGLGDEDPSRNPLAAAPMPHLRALLGGQPLTAAAVGEYPQATLLALDATLGMPGAPQSATGQAALITGINVPQQIGGHYGPKPNPAVGAWLAGGGIFGELQAAGRSSALLAAYPPRFFEGIASGRRLLAALPWAAARAGVRLRDRDDLEAGQALSADFTAAAWRTQLGAPDTPLLTPTQAGARLAQLGRAHDFALFEYWLTDVAGHRRDPAAAHDLLALLDAVIGGLVAAWGDAPGLILITSDHGNLEDIGVKGHTRAHVPGLLLGPLAKRRDFGPQSGVPLRSLIDVVPAVRRALGLTNPSI
jgi:hypothetical protein